MHSLYTKEVARQDDKEEIALETPSVEKCIVLIKSEDILYTLLVTSCSSMVTKFPIHYIKAILNSKILLEVMSFSTLKRSCNCTQTDRSFSRDVGH